MKKHIKGFLVGVIFTLILSNTVVASQIKKTIEVTFNSINLQINGKNVVADNILYNGTTYVPLRKAAEMLGKEVDWRQETKTANIIDIQKKVVEKEIPKEIVKEVPKDIVITETVTYNNGDRYVGVTKNGQRHGKGIYYYKDGSRYEGDWFTDFESGKGIAYFSNGRKNYEINFPYGTESGKITYFYNDGGRYEGQINNGILASYGASYFSDGGKYEGEYKDNKEHGIGKYTHANGNYLQGEFSKGEFMTGVGQFNINGVSNTVYYKDGYEIPSNLPTTNYPITTGVIESRIDGEFTGWTGDTIFKLQNGQIWQQSSYNYRYSYKYSPKVIIYQSGIGYKMKVDGVDGEISVKRLK